MAIRKIEILFAIPEDIYQAIPASEKLAFQTMVRGLKAKAVKVNAGLPNEEATVDAWIHLCFHDEGSNKPCEAKVEI